MFEKNQELTLRIEDITDQGQGIGKVDGFAVFVPNTLPGDLVDVILTKVKKRYAFGTVTGMKELSADRIESVCAYSEDCGGCVFSEYDYGAQLALKQKQVTDKLQRLAGIEEPPVKDIIGADDPFRYRNKAVLQISVDEISGEPSVGFFRVRTHDIVDCADCVIQRETVSAAAEAMRGFLRQRGKQRGKDHKNCEIRSMTVRTAPGTGDVMVTVSIKGKEIPDVEELVMMLDESIAETGYYLESFYVENDKYVMPVAGRNVIEEKIGDLKFEISPLSFYQVNPAMMVKLYDKVREYAALKEDDVLLDAYCGVGSIGLWCAEDAGYIVGIEREHQAILDANRNAVINGIVNARYIEGAAEDVMSSVAAMRECAGFEERQDDNIVSGYRIDEELAGKIRNTNVAVIDPPRAGCDQKMIDALCLLAPKRIVYVSCDPATLARDIKALREGGYEIVEATPVDMFPWTKHVETVVLMSRK